MHFFPGEVYVTVRYIYYTSAEFLFVETRNYLIITQNHFH